MSSPKRLADIDAKLLNLALADQRASTIAMTLRMLPSDRAPGIVGQLDPEKRHAVVRCLRIAHPQPLPTVVDEIRNGLIARIDAIQRTGPMRAATILDQCDRQTEWSVLQSIADCDPELSVAIDQSLFTFECLAWMDERSLRTLLRNVELKTWAMALKRCPRQTTRRIIQLLCPRALGLLSEEFEYLGTVSTAELAEAHAEIVDAARRLRRRAG